MSSPQLFILLPQVEDAVCNPKIRQVTDSEDREPPDASGDFSAPPHSACSSYMRQKMETKLPSFSCVCVRVCVGGPTFELGHLQLFDLLQLVVALSVLVQLPVVVVALGLVLVLQLVILLLQVLVLVLPEDATAALRRPRWSGAGDADAEVPSGSGAAPAGSSSC